MSEFERYSIVWHECHENSQISQRFYMPKYKGFLPFFLSGVDLIALEKKEKVLLREEHLLKGILYGLKEFDRFQINDKVVLFNLLDILRNFFEFETPEQMVLEVAGNLRQVNGHKASLRVLDVGNELVPQSSKIKCDLVLELWIKISEQGGQANLFEKILDLVSKTRMDEIYPGSKEIICYYGLCSLVFLKRGDELDDYFREYIYPNVSNRALKVRIKEFLQNPGEFLPEDLIID